MNQYRTQEPPFTVKITLNEGCNLYCDFCGLRGIRTREMKNYKPMTEDTLVDICTQIRGLGWTSKIEFTGRGEPTMNPEFISIVKATRDILPDNQIMMTSNGGGFLGGSGPVAKLRAVFDAGLNILVLDDYEDANIVPKIRAGIERLNDPLGIEFYEYTGAHGEPGNPYRRYSISTKMITFMADLKQTAAQTKGIRSKINNAGGAGGPPNDRQKGKRCHRPFRELDIRWDGTVGLCCQDWRGAYKCGSVIVDGLDAVWQGAAMNAARRKLYRGQRDFSICRGCDSVTSRSGLLPDPAGRFDVPPTDAEDMAAIDAAMAGPAYTAPVLREWEKK